MNISKELELKLKKTFPQRKSQDQMVSLVISTKC